MTGLFRRRPCPPLSDASLPTRSFRPPSINFGGGLLIQDKVEKNKKEAKARQMHKNATKDKEAKKTKKKQKTANK